ncbi:Transcriptional regulatory protein OmpR [uncultured delta proteobacterium]|uniref:Transcriptional regulatory protein OmpR n=1 Tax=uncultured delta proteobacterium TaxID=34034 RepID=A0A212IXX6_9DELT|nr:Transcriptional regulatory protein OmpR [uncultured delta proteobacterium]
MTEPRDPLPRVLMVDDDERLQNVVREFLEGHGFAVSALSSGKGLAETIEAARPDLLLLDVMLPGDDGFTILRTLRAKSKIPVIMLTACGDETDRIVGLEIGADDYLGKPFNPRELLARIRAVLRRAPDKEKREGGREEKTAANAEGLILLDGFTLDEKRQRLSHGEASVDLSFTEFRILDAFMSRPGEVLSREKVLSLVFGDDHYVCDRNIDVYISRIRGILRKLGEKETRIRTVWGAGYSWVTEA